MLKRTLALLALLGLLAAPALAADSAEPPKTPDAAGRADALFKQGKIQEAHDAYAAAAEADPENPELARKTRLLARVLELEGMVASEDAGPQWEKMVQALHGFYHNSDLPENALKLDKKAHEKADSAMTGGMVMESLLTLDRNQEALTFAESLREGQFNDSNRIFRGIARARLGKLEALKEEIELEGMPKAKDAGVAFDLARMQTLMGEKKMGLETLKSAFETCPPQALKTLKTMAKASADLKALHGTEAFARVLETKSKVGSGCGSCGGCSGGGCGHAK